MSDIIAINPRERIEEPERLGPVPFITLHNVSGGGLSEFIEEAALILEEFRPEGGGALPIIYGEHIVAGILIVHRFTPGSPNVSIIYIAIGDGEGNGGGHGALDGVVTIWYGGAVQSVSGSGTAAGYRFYNGFISTGVASGPQQVDAFLPTNQAFSGTSYYAIKLTDADANAENRPDKLRARVKGRRTYNFNASGVNLGSSYSVNPARAATDRILAFFEHQFPFDIPRARKELEEGVNWDAWTTWRDFNGATISWNNGVSSVNIARFEFQGAFTDDVNLAEALDQICASCGAHWVDDGPQIVFLPPSEREPVHHFNESNIIAGSVQIEPRALQDRPNFFVGRYRDVRDTFLGLTTTPPIRRDKAIKQVGQIQSVQTLPNMNQSQAQRLMAMRAQLEHDNHVVISLVGDATSMDVLPFEFVTVSHSLGDWNYQRFLVLEMELLSAEEGPDICAFTLLEMKDILYSDTLHGPQQIKADTLSPTSNSSPDSVQGGTAVTTPTNTGHATTSAVNVGAAEMKTCIWTAFQTITGTVTKLTLKVDWAEDGSITGGSSQFFIHYSTDGGSNWNVLIDHLNVGSPASGTASVELSAGQNISQVQVRDRLHAITATASLFASVSNIRLEVEFL